MQISQIVRLAAIVLTIQPIAALGQDRALGDTTGPYAGFESREIAGLSAADIEELRLGGGWGLALPAELNGYPGPAHIIELQEELGLSTEQMDAISEIYEGMRSAAIAAAERFISAEANLSDERLSDLLAEAGQARTALRFVHLSRHLMTPGLLTATQLERYAVLRGYAEDVCENIPAGHDPEMWRRHNGCD